ncbi:hypothetical protein GCM10009771_12330 [Nesterenkonia flava]
MKGKVRGAAAVQRWFALAEEALQVHSHRLNRLNVFPVADSDTGANMLATVRACRGAVEASPAQDLGELLATAGSKAMAGACGNSGTLLAVLISGFAEPLHGTERLTIAGLSRALERASLRAWSALSNPVNGTMLSVLDALRDEAAEQARHAAEPESRAALEAAMDPLIHAAREALAATEHQLGPLAQARVVDSGGLGLLLVVLALAATVRGQELDHNALERDMLSELAGWQASEPADETRPAPPSASSAVEIMSTVRLSPLEAASLRHQLDELGESVIITPIEPVTADAQAGSDDGTEPAHPVRSAPQAVTEEIDAEYRWRIHLHAEDEHAALAAIESAGTVESSTVTPLSGGGQPRE